MMKRRAKKMKTIFQDNDIPFILDETNDKIPSEIRSWVLSFWPDDDSENETDEFEELPDFE